MIGVALLGAVMSLTEEKLIEFYKSNIALPRTKKVNWFITALLYEAFGKRDILDIGCFTGSNTTYFAYLAKQKNARVIAIDNWSQGTAVGISKENLRNLFEANIKLLGASDNVVLIESELNTDLFDMSKVDFIMHDIWKSDTEDLVSLLQKCTRPTIVSIDDYNGSFTSKRDLDIEKLLTNINGKTIYMTERRYFLGLNYTDYEIINMTSYIKDKEDYVRNNDFFKIFEPNRGLLT